MSMYNISCEQTVWSTLFEFCAYYVLCASSSNACVLRRQLFIELQKIIDKNMQVFACFVRHLIIFRNMCRQQVNMRSGHLCIFFLRKVFGENVDIERASIIIEWLLSLACTFEIVLFVSASICYALQRCILNMILAGFCIYQSISLPW